MCWTVHSLKKGMHFLFVITVIRPLYLIVLFVRSLAQVFWELLITQYREGYKRQEELLEFLLHRPLKEAAWFITQFIALVTCTSFTWLNNQVFGLLPWELLPCFSVTVADRWGCQSGRVSVRIQEAARSKRTDSWRGCSKMTVKWIVYLILPSDKLNLYA